MTVIEKPSYKELLRLSFFLEIFTVFSLFIDSKTHFKECVCLWTEPWLSVEGTETLKLDLLSCMEGDEVPEAAPEAGIGEAEIEAGAEIAVPETPNLPPPPPPPLPPP